MGERFPGPRRSRGRAAGSRPGSAPRSEAAGLRAAARRFFFHQVPLTIRAPRCRGRGPGPGDLVRAVGIDARSCRRGPRGWRALGRRRRRVLDVDDERGCGPLRSSRTARFAFAPPRSRPDRRGGWRRIGRGHGREGTTCRRRRSFSGGRRSSRTMRRCSACSSRPVRPPDRLRRQLLPGRGLPRIADSSRGAAPAAGLDLRRAVGLRAAPAGPPPAAAAAAHHGLGLSLLRGATCSGAPARRDDRHRSQATSCASAGSTVQPRTLGLTSCISSPGMPGALAASGRGNGAPGPGRRAGPAVVSRASRTDAASCLPREPGAPRSWGGSVARTAAGGARSPAPGGEPDPLHLLHDSRPEDQRPTGGKRADRPGHGRGRAGLRAAAPSPGDETLRLGVLPPVPAVLERCRSAAPLPASASAAVRQPSTARSRRRRCPRRPSRRSAAGPSALVLLHLTRRGLCGFYVGKADTLALQRPLPGRSGTRREIVPCSTMRNDDQGRHRVRRCAGADACSKREQIDDVNRKLLEHLDALLGTASGGVLRFRSVQGQRHGERRPWALGRGDGAALEREKKRDEALGVRIEGEVLGGRVRHPDPRASSPRGRDVVRETCTHPGQGSGRAPAVHPSGMKFFVAQGDFQARRKSGSSTRAPCRSPTSEEVQLPIRLGMANASGARRIPTVYAPTRRGRWSRSTTGRRGSLRPERPLFVKSDFGKLYQDVFARRRAGGSPRGVRPSTSGTWGWCDGARAAAEPRGAAAAGGLLVDGPVRRTRWGRCSAVARWADGQRAVPGSTSLRRGGPPRRFRVPGDVRRYQLPGGILQDPYQGASECSAMDDYRERCGPAEKEAENLASRPAGRRRTSRRRWGRRSTQVKSRPWYRWLWTTDVSVAPAAPVVRAAGPATRSPGRREGGGRSPRGTNQCTFCRAGPMLETSLGSVAGRRRDGGRVRRGSREAMSSQARVKELRRAARLEVELREERVGGEGAEEVAAVRHRREIVRRGPWGTQGHHAPPPRGRAAEQARRREPVRRARQRRRPG